MIRTTTRLVLFVVLWSAASLAHAQDLAPKLDAILSGYQKNRSFIGAALIAKGGKVIFEKGYGMANVELDVPNGPDTKFRLGSITKQFTATAILQLEEQGKLSVKDAACKYLPECPESWKALTINQLLSHTSGIRSYADGPEFAKPKMMRIPLKPVGIARNSGRVRQQLMNRDRLPTLRAL